ncbi:MAG: hypothetical protein F6J98_38290, partial [Moorea sp. SIO4G2]|nr:hypothetical protein [Moorena sp. SIO4G2]
SDAARSWEGSAVLGVSPMSDCRGFPHSLLHQDIGSLILEVIESPECGQKNDILMTHSFTPNLDDETPKAHEIVPLAQF